MDTKFITVSVVGETNVGKSTLVNSLVRRKVSIATPKTQTTRSSITGIRNFNETQILFTDNPGIFIPKSTLEKSIVKCAWHGMYNSLLTLLVIDTSSGEISQITESIIKKLDGQVMIALNKVDQSSIAKITTLKASLAFALPSAPQFMVSAISGVGTEALLSHIANLAPHAPWQYDSHTSTTMPIAFMAAEITREQAFLQMGGELPYNLNVETESIESIGKDAYQIKQVITVIKESHKMIVIGKGGARLRSIGEKARKEMYKTLGIKVDLRIFVRIRANWMQNQLQD
jgi:GTPase